MSIEDLQGESENELGRQLIAQGRIEEAIAVLEREIERDFRSSCAHLDLGAALRLNQRREEAVRSFRTALTLQPDWPLAWYNLGGTLFELGDLPGAIAAFRQTVTLQPDWGLPYCGLGTALLGRREMNEAKLMLRKARELVPDWHAAGHYLAMTHLACEESGAAISVYQEELQRHPEACHECHLSLGFALLTNGEYPGGWKEYEWRWQTGGRTPVLSGLDGPVWDGSPLDGKTIVLWSDQGLGDILQFVRFATLVAERGGNVSLLSRPCLDRLLASCPGVTRVVSQAEELGDCDCQFPLSSLPLALGISVDDLPAVSVPYLKPLERWSADPLGPRRGGELRLGIVWAVEPGQPSWEQRSCPLPLFRALESMPGLELYSLQFGSRSAELRQPGAPPMADLSAVLGDFANTAAVIDHLDLILTVDTSMAHLAGAIGKPVWTLIPYGSDWRWLRDREDSPWYPTMRLFRQETPGCWEPVIERVAAALRSLGTRRDLR